MSDDIHDRMEPVMGSRGESNAQAVHGIPFKRTELKPAFLERRKVTRKHFVNTLNYHNFINAQVFTLLRHTLTQEDFLFTVYPGPCRDDIVTCTIPGDVPETLDAFEIKGLVMDNGDSLMIMEVDPVEISPSSFTVKFRGAATLCHSRQVKRNPCVMVEAHIRFKETVLKGNLREFHPSGLSVTVMEGFKEELGALRNGDTSTIHLFRKGERVYSGTARLIRSDPARSIIVLAPLNMASRMYNERKFRNTRLNPVPRPRVVFEHTFTEKKVVYDIVDINTSGFSIEERSERVLLIPGMIFHAMEIVFSGELSLTCSAQVVYCKKKWGGITKFGFAITDIDPVTYTRLFNLLTRTDDPHSIASSKISLEALWEFFFRSGFIYPDKYLCISQYKETFRKTYEHLYHNCPEIFSSLTYQMNDQIYGHVSIIKAYPSTWMVHHLAALPMGSRRTGLYVLQQILNYLDGFHRMPSIGMKYLIFYYRPDNKFPNHFFGGVYRILDAPYICSVDEFGYLIHRLPEVIRDLPVGWNLSRCTAEDLAALHEAYHNNSQGLMIEAFDLENDDDTLWRTYRRLGLKRECKPYVLTRDSDRMAFLIVDRSDRGLNLSDLLNNIKIILPHPHHRALSWEILQDAVAVLGSEFGTPEVVLQVFPSAYLDDSGVRYPKKYCMWIVKARYFDPHLDAIKKMTKFKYLKFLKSMIESMLGLNK